MTTLLAIVFAGAVAAAAPPASPAPPEGSAATHRQAALELMEAMKIERNLNQTVDLVINAQVQAAPQLAPFEDLMRGFLGKYLSYESVRDDYAQLYEERFTEPELRQLTAFYRSDAGQKLIATLPDIMKKGMELGQAKLADHIDELKELLTKRAEELKAKQQLP